MPLFNDPPSHIQATFVPIQINSHRKHPSSCTPQWKKYEADSEGSNGLRNVPRLHPGLLDLMRVLGKQAHCASKTLLASEPCTSGYHASRYHRSCSPVKEVRRVESGRPSLQWSRASSESHYHDNLSVKCDRESHYQYIEDRYFAIKNQVLDYSPPPLCERDPTRRNRYSTDSEGVGLVDVSTQMSYQKRVNIQDNNDTFGTEGISSNSPCKEFANRILDGEQPTDDLICSAELTKIKHLLKSGDKETSKILREMLCVLRELGQQCDFSVADVIRSAYDSEADAGLGDETVRSFNPPPVLWGDQSIEYVDGSREEYTPPKSQNLPKPMVSREDSIQSDAPFNVPRPHSLSPTPESDHTFSINKNELTIPELFELVQQITDVIIVEMCNQQCWKSICSKTIPRSIKAGDPFSTKVSGITCKAKCSKDVSCYNRAPNPEEPLDESFNTRTPSPGEESTKRSIQSDARMTSEAADMLPEGPQVADKSTATAKRPHTAESSTNRAETDRGRRTAKSPSKSPIRDKGRRTESPTNRSPTDVYKPTTEFPANLSKADRDTHRTESPANRSVTGRDRHRTESPANRSITGRDRHRKESPMNRSVTGRDRHRTESPSNHSVTDRGRSPTKSHMNCAIPNRDTYSDSPTNFSIKDRGKRTAESPSKSPIRDRGRHTESPANRSATVRRRRSSESPTNRPIRDRSRPTESPANRPTTDRRSSESPTERPIRDTGRHTEFPANLSRTDRRGRSESPTKSPIRDRGRHAESPANRSTTDRRGHSSDSPKVGFIADRGRRTESPTNRLTTDRLRRSSESTTTHQKTDRGRPKESPTNWSTTDRRRRSSESPTNPPITDKPTESPTNTARRAKESPSIETHIVNANAASYSTDDAEVTEESSKEPSTLHLPSSNVDTSLEDQRTEQVSAAPVAHNRKGRHHSKKDAFSEDRQKKLKKFALIAIPILGLLIGGTYLLLRHNIADVDCMDV